MKTQENTNENTGQIQENTGKQRKKQNTGKVQGKNTKTIGKTRKYRKIQEKTGYVHENRENTGKNTGKHQNTGKH